MFIHGLCKCVTFPFIKHSLLFQIKFNLLTFLEIATKMHKFTSVNATPTRINHPQFGLYSARKVVPMPPSADPDEAAGGFWVDSALLLPAVGGRFVVKVKAEIFTND
jgi:hypothetical protein